jgi:hypothetical protein
MSSVDDRAVHMTFDNKSFEKNLAETMKSMDSLKKSLDFTNAKRSFTDLGDHASRFNLGNVGMHVEGISNKFLALGTIAITTLANITNRAIDAGINIAKSLTIAPITEGFSDYNAKLTSVQTITNATGESLETVSGFFKELDTYADKTVYNLSDMTGAFAKFTNAGIDMEVAVPAIKGIANMTALAGQGAGEAAIAMYNLSQSLAGGFLTTTDYKSLNLANVATKQWKDYMIEAAIAAGTLRRTGEDSFEILVDGSNAVANSGQLFNNELSRGWATADILIDVLGDFGDTSTEIGAKAQAAAQDVKSLPMMFDTLRASVGTGWTDTFEILFGNLDESKELFTDLTTSISGVLEGQAKWRNDLLQGWKDLGGRTKLIEGVKDMFGALYQVVRVASTQFHRFFGSLDSESLFNLTERFANFMEAIRNNEDLFDRLSTAFGAIFAGLKIGIEVIKGIIGVFVDLFQHFTGGGAGNKMFDFIDKTALKIIDLHTALVTNGGLDKIFERITDKLIAFGEALKNPGQLLETVKETIAEFFQGIDFGSFDGIREAFERTFSGALELINTVKDYILDLFNIDVDFNFRVPEGIKDFFNSLFGNIDESTTNSVDIAGGLDRISTALEAFWDVVKTIADVVGFFFDKLMDFGGWVISTGGKVLDFFQELGPNLQKAFMSEEFDKFLETLQTIAQLMGGAGFLGLGTKGLDVNVGGDLTGGMLPRFNALLQSFVTVGPSVSRTFEGLTGVFKTMQTEIKAKALLKIAEAIALITASVVVLSFIEPEAIAKSLSALAVGFGQLVASFAAISAVASGPKGAAGFSVIAGGLVALSAAILILSGAVAVLAHLNWEEMARGLVGLDALLASIVVTAHFLEGNAVAMIGAGVGMTAMAVALTILGGAMKIYATMSWAEMGKGLAGIAGGLLIMAGALQLMPLGTILIGPGLVAVAFALAELAAAMLIFATMSWEEMGKGLAAIGGGLAIIAGAMHLMPVSSIITGPALIAVATGLTILGGALKIFATMSWEEIGKAMTVLGSSLVILGIGLELMSGTLAGAAAVGVAAVSFLILSKALKELAKMSWKDLGKGLGVLAAALTAIGLAAYALSATGATGAIFTLGLALIALGVGITLLGVGAGLFAEAFQIMAAAGTAGIDVLMYAIDQLLIRLPEIVQAFATSILDTLEIILDAAPGLIQQLSKVIGELLRMIASNADEFGKAAITWIEQILKTIRDASPDFVKTGFKLIMDFLHGMEDNVTELTRTVSTIIVRFITELTKHTPELVAAGIEWLQTFLEGLTKDLDKIAESVGDLIAEFILQVGKQYTKIQKAGTDAFVEFLGGMGDNIQDIIKAAARLIGDILDALLTAALILANRMLDVLVALMNGLADAIDTHDEEINDAAYNLVWAIVEGIITAIGLKKVADALWNQGKSMATKVIKGFWDTINPGSPSKVFMDISKHIPEGVVHTLDHDTSAEVAGADLAKRTTNAFQMALASVRDTLPYSDEFNPTITPVLDLTQVQAAAGGINGLLAAQQLTADVSVQAANQLLAETTPRDDDDEDKEAPVRSLSFTQINNSPEALSTAKIYKNTNSQIARAKEELEKV